jgi:hypothetical protein
MERGLNITSANAPGVTSVGGILPIKSVKQLQDEERQKAIEDNNAPVVQQLAAYLRQKWVYARTAKENTAEQKMLKSLRQRRGEYDPDKLAAIKEQGSSEIYMMLTSNKCRAGASWLRDVLMTTAEDKPWTIEPSPVVELRPDLMQEVMQQATSQIQMALESGVQPDQAQVRQMMSDMHDRALSELQNKAKDYASRMDKKMYAQLLEGNWTHAFADFIDDIVTFPSAFLKGPVVRKRPKLHWVPDGQGDFNLDVQDTYSLEWERVSPFDIYPAPDSSSVDGGYLIERHRLQRADLVALLDVEGYSNAAIREVLDEYGKGGLREWLYIDLSRATAEGKSTIGAGQNPSELIDALQFWGNIQGKLLKEWGMTEEEIPDDLAEYPVEAWLIGRWIIKAVINPDPLGRKNYFKASYEEVPGAFWGNSIADLCRDVQDMCNGAARALANNMGLASGPQVIVNIDRLPAGEQLTQMFPWKLWQVTSDPTGGNSTPIEFFQPGSNVQELMAVYEKFAILADEYTGIPRYMTGDAAVGGAGRTASGMSMLMSNAGKAIKQVIANIDEKVIEPCIDRLYYYNMRYSEDKELKGDINIVARGAESLIEKESAAQRQQQFLQVALMSPIVQDIVGKEGIAELIREGASRLDMNTDNIVAPLSVLKQRWAQQEEQQMAMMQQQEQAKAQASGQIEAGGTPPAPQGPGAILQNGQPVTNNFANRPAPNA